MDSTQFREGTNLNRQDIPAGIYPPHQDATPEFSVFTQTRAESGRTKSHSHLQVNTAPIKMDSSKFLRQPASSSPLDSESLLAYTRDPAPFPPSNNGFVRTPILPHPHAPKAPPRHIVLQPAIHRSPLGAAQSPIYHVSPSHKALLDALSMAATVGHTQGPLQGKATIHGRTSHDLLSSPGPVPIEFALNDQRGQGKPPEDSPGVEFVAAPTDVVSAPKFSKSSSSSSGPSIHVSDAADATRDLELILRPRPNASVEKPRPRSRSFSGIITAFETPRQVTPSRYVSHWTNCNTVYCLLGVIQITPVCTRHRRTLLTHCRLLPWPMIPTDLAPVGLLRDPTVPRLPLLQ
jgi:hypothetical protein